MKDISGELNVHRDESMNEYALTITIRTMQE